MNPQDLYLKNMIAYTIFEKDLIHNGMDKSFIYNLDFNTLVLILNEKKQIEKLKQKNKNLNDCLFVLKCLNYLPHQNILNYLLNNFNSIEIITKAKEIEMKEEVKQEINKIFKNILNKELKEEIENKNERKKRRI